jgi:hypothetical protein
MREVGSVLRSAYFAKLNGSVTLDGVTIPVFDSFVPDKTDTSKSFAYILLSTLSEVPTNQTNKDNFSSEVAFTVDVRTGSTQPTGFKKAELIADIVKTLICPHDPADYLDLSPDFQNVTTIQQMGNTITEKTDTLFVYRKIIRFKHTILQLT